MTIRINYRDQTRRPPAPNVCAFCGKRVHVAKRAHRWVNGDAWGISTVIQVHAECYAAALDALQEGAR